MRDRLTSRFFLLGGALCALLAATIFLADLFKPVDHVLNDWRIRFALESRPESRVVVVDVDERSLAARSAIDGAWPWPRATIANLLKILIDDYAVSSVAVDMVFPEQRADDDLLAAQFRRPQVTGAVTYDLERRDLPPMTFRMPAPPPLQGPGDMRVNGIPAVTNHNGLLPAQTGHITPIFDSDGVLRRVPPLICVDGHQCRPALTIASFVSLLESPRFFVTRGEGPLSPAWKLSIGAGGVDNIATLPLTREGMLIVPYRHTPDDWVSVSAADILERKVDPKILKGVMVLLGGTALGLADQIATPISPVAAGVVPHVEVLSAVLENQFLIEPQWGWALDALLLLPFVIVLAWAPRRFQGPVLRAAVFPTWLLLTWGASVAAALAAFEWLHLLLPLVPLLLFPPLAVLLMLVAELYRSGSEHAGVFSLLSAYLPRPVAAQLASFKQARSAVNTTMDASRKEITVLFADVHGFAGLSENRPPEIIASLMQRFFSEMAEAVVANNGTIDKFIGDAIMAFWNAPADDPQHARNALNAAQEIHWRIEALAPFCAELGVPPISVGIGIESGEALVGNFGSAHRRTYTALGEPVVLASRLEGLTTGYNEAILVGPVCAHELGMTDMRALGKVQIRGRVQPLMLYAPI